MNRDLTKKMKKLRQRDYPNLFLGKTRSTVAKYGCYVVCHAIINDLSVSEVISIFNREGVFSRDLVKHPDDALALGYDSYRVSRIDPRELCIAEVDFNPDPDKDQHFVVWLGNGEIIDPWDGKQKKNKYKVYSYRIYNKFKTKEMTNKKREKDYSDNFRSIYESIEKLLNRKDGNNPNDSETKEIVKELKELKIKINDLENKKPITVTIEKEIEKIVYQDTPETLEKLENQKEEINKLLDKRSAFVKLLERVKKSILDLWNFKG